MTVTSEKDEETIIVVRTGVGKAKKGPSNRGISCLLIEQGNNVLEFETESLK